MRFLNRNHNVGHPSFLQDQSTRLPSILFRTQAYLWLKQEAGPIAWFFLAAEVELLSEAQRIMIVKSMS